MIANPIVVLQAAEATLPAVAEAYAILAHLSGEAGGGATQTILSYRELLEEADAEGLHRLLRGVAEELAVESTTGAYSPDRKTTLENAERLVEEFLELCEDQV